MQLGIMQIVMEMELPNGTEVTNGTNPLNPDSDGDGVTDGTEIADGTNPLNLCSLALSHQTLPTSAAWNKTDCDGDGLPNGTEITNGTNPLSPDSDGDGVYRWNRDCRWNKSN